MVEMVEKWKCISVGLNWLSVVRLEAWEGLAGLVKAKKVAKEL
jgi:hypothetical protein